MDYLFNTFFGSCGMFDEWNFENDELNINFPGIEKEQIEVETIKDYLIIKKDNKIYLRFKLLNNYMVDSAIYKNGQLKIKFKQNEENIKKIEIE